MLDRSLPAIFGKQFAGLDAGALAAAGRALVDAEPRTFSEPGGLLSPDAVGDEAQRLLRFAADGDSREIQFAPVA